MNTRNTAIAVFLLVLIIASCKTQSTSSSSDNLQDINKNAKERFEKTKTNSEFQVNTGMCLGKCPIFKFYYSEGLAAISVRENILTPGDFVYKLTDDEANRLEELIGSVEWGKMNEEYKTQAKDLPTIEFTTNFQNTTKKVIVQGLEPRKLVTLKDTIVELVKSYDWQKIPGE